MNHMLLSYFMLIYSIYLSDGPSTRIFIELHPNSSKYVHTGIAYLVYYFWCKNN